MYEFTLLLFSLARVEEPHATHRKSVFEYAMLYLRTRCIQPHHGRPSKLEYHVRKLAGLHTAYKASVDGHARASLGCYSSAFLSGQCLYRALCRCAWTIHVSLVRVLDITFNFRVRGYPFDYCGLRCSRTLQWRYTVDDPTQGTREF